VVFQAEDGIWFLDTLEGSLTQIWDSTGALKTDLATASGQDRYLLAGLAIGAEHQGLIPTPARSTVSKPRRSSAVRSTWATSKLSIS
jgi:hypothetical protein